MSNIGKIALSRGLTIGEFFLEAWKWRNGCDPSTETNRGIVEATKRYQKNPDVVPYFVNEYISHLTKTAILPRNAWR